MLADAQNRGTSVAEAARLEPAHADALTADSAFLDQLGALAPWLDTGPDGGAADLAGAEQHWIASRRPDWVAPAPDRLTRSELLDVDAAADGQLTSAPAGPLGLWTSTASSRTPSMWRLFLQREQGGGLWRKPWRTWRCATAPGTRIAAVANARDWADLVARHHVTVDGLLRPDWRAIGRSVDAVHFAPRAVCATDGFVLSTAAGDVAPTHRSVECTLWLRWAFADVELIATDPPQPSAQDLDE